MHRQHFRHCLARAFVALAGLGLLAVAPAHEVLAQETRPFAAEQELLAHSNEFRQEVIEVTDGVWVAVGYALSNAILIEGADGVIVVDTTESQAAAQAIQAEFARLTTKPVVAVVYTHNHYDHVYGTPVFAAGREIEVFAHRLLPELVARRSSEVAQAMLARNIRQFGITLPDAARPNCGIGPKLVLGGPVEFVPPTTLVDDRLEVEVAGVRLVLVHAPGETADQLNVWLPDKRVLLPGDDYYKAFPNLYAIRGTPYRDVREWAESVERMLAFEPEVLVPSHSRPLIGAERIRTVLGDYRDAIRSVYDQTIAGMNRGLGPDALVEQVRLPPELAAKPYLRELYGTVAWAVRAIYAGNLGWFDGNATHLFPLSPAERGRKMIELAGGEERLLGAARAAAGRGEHQWTAELADHLLAVAPDHAEAKRLKAEALIALGRQQTSANGRNYYMTSARELGAEVPQVATPPN